MLPGHASLPNGFGLDFVDGDGQAHVPGVAPNSLTSTDWRDAYAGTPWHKHVPARIEAGARRGGSELSRHREHHSVTATQHLLQ